ncbi:MAG: anaerobic ribonucleoside-triphosphate reductase, partial [Actinomycetia bacterium]|nr:anaerobic ribonucleoside-triphosphate reductase [Actinomycetes bacterium]
FITRPYCGGHSLEYVKKYGISLPNITSTSKPAKHPEVLIGHMVKMASTLQSHYAGAIGWEAVNMFFAPLLRNIPYKKIKQLAQMLIYEFNQLAGARGSQVVFTDFNLYYGIPKHFVSTPAVGLGGKYLKEKDGKLIPVDEIDDEVLTYKDFEHEANLFLKALFEIYLEGDATGKTFVFPKPLLHINENLFTTPGWEEFLDLACKVASVQGITYFVFDRGGEVTVSQCCRLKLKLGEKDLLEAKTPEKLRFTALQNVTINLPRIAYKAEGSDETIFNELERALNLVFKAHLEKKSFIGKLLAIKDKGPLAFFTSTKNGDPYLRMDRLTFLVGILGLNEMVQTHIGKQLHESDEALKFGLKVIAFMNVICKKKSEELGLKFVL